MFARALDGGTASWAACVPPPAVRGGGLAPSPVADDGNSHVLAAES